MSIPIHSAAVPDRCPHCDQRRTLTIEEVELLPSWLALLCHCSACHGVFQVHLDWMHKGDTIEGLTVALDALTKEEVAS